MNTTTQRTLTSAPANHFSPKTETARREHRARDFGIGYGSSSGYGLSKRYTSDWGQPRFRFS